VPEILALIAIQLLAFCRAEVKVAALLEGVATFKPTMKLQINYKLVRGTDRTPKRLKCRRLKD
jgi:hypothetical protein